MNKKKHSPKRSRESKNVSVPNTSSNTPVIQNVAATTPPRPMSATSRKLSSANAGVAQGDIRNFDYVYSDVKRLSILMGILIVFEVGIWLLAEHTGFGAFLYNLIPV